MKLYSIERDGEGDKFKYKITSESDKCHVKNKTKSFDKLFTREDEQALRGGACNLWPEWQKGVSFRDI